MVLVKIGGVQKKNGALAGGTTKFHFGLLAEQSLLSPQASSPSLEPKKIKIHPRSLGVVGWWGNSTIPKAPTILYGQFVQALPQPVANKFSERLLSLVGFLW